MTRQVDGSGGELRAGYQPAARLGTWAVTRREDERVFDATCRVRWRSEYWAARERLTLVLDVGYDQWEWADVAPKWDGDAVSCELVGLPTVVRGSRVA